MSQNDMSENEDTLPGEEPTVDSPASISKPPPAARKKTTGQSWRWISRLFWLGVIAAIGVGLYISWPQVKEYPDRFATLEQNNQERGQQLTDLRQQLQQSQQQWQQQLAQQREQVQEAVRINQQLRSQLEEQQQQIRNLAATTSDDWKMAEAYYLTRMAGQRLVMERNAGSALALLQTADTIVKERADPQLYPVREQLAKDMVALKLASEFDRQGIFLQLSALQQSLQQLPQLQLKNYGELVQPGASPNQNAESGEAGEIELGLWQRMQRSVLASLTTMKDLVRVTHHDQPLQAPPAPELHQWLQARIQGTLQSAQLALLRDQEAVYQSSLQQAQALLQQHYSSSETRTLVTTLEELQQQVLDRSLPDISQSERLLGEYLDRLHKVGAQESSPNNREAAAPTFPNPPERVPTEREQPTPEPTPPDVSVDNTTDSEAMQDQTL